MVTPPEPASRGLLPATWGQEPGTARHRSPQGLRVLGNPSGELGQEIGLASWQAPAEWMLAKGLRERQRDRAQGHLMGEDTVRTE